MTLALWTASRHDGWVSDEPISTSAARSHLPGRPVKHAWLLALVAVLAVLVTAPTGWLPRLANNRLRACLQARGLQELQVRIERLTPWNLRASLDLTAPGGASQVDRIDIQFTPSGLCHARLERVEIEGGLLQFRADTNGLVLCGLPLERLQQLGAGRAPAGVAPQGFSNRWLVGKVLVDHVTLRLLPPVSGGSRGLSPALSSDRSAEKDTAPFDICLHASAATDPQGDTHLVLADYGRAGLLVNGAIRLDSGDGWVVATLPEGQVREWVRVAQWYLHDPVVSGRNLCVGSGCATLQARMERWSPVLVQGDLSLHATTLLPEYSCTYDLQAHGVAQWEHAKSQRPTVGLQADVGIRAASGPAFSWANDRELPACVSLALKLTPQPVAWECQAAAHAVLSHSAAQSFLPERAVQLPEAPSVWVDGLLTSPDLSQWSGVANALLLVPQPRWSAGDGVISCSDLVVQATAVLSNSAVAWVNGRAGTAGLRLTGNGVACAATLEAGFASCAPFERADLAVTARVASVSIPGGIVVFDAAQPPQLLATATVQRSTSGGVSFREAALQVAPVPVAWKGASGMEAAGVVALAGHAGTSGNRLRMTAGVQLTNLMFHAGDVTGGVACADLALIEELTHGATILEGLQCDTHVAGGWLQGIGGVQLDGVQLHLLLEGSGRALGVRGVPELSWSRLAYQGIPVQPEGMALTLTDQTATVRIQAGLADLGLHAQVLAHADWSRAWQVAVTAEVPPTVLADTAAQRGLLRRFTGMDLGITGEVAATVSTLFAADRPVNLKICAAVTNLDMGCTAEKWQVSGVATRVLVDGPRGWRTPQGEELTFRSARKGDVALDAGLIRWQFRRDTLLVEQADVGWCKGMLHLYGLSCDLQHPDLDFVVYADRIHLGELMAQTQALHGTGEGTLFGRIPVRVKDGRVRLTEGYLNTLPGEPGRLKLENAELINTALESGQVERGVREKLQKALRDLTLSAFRMQLSGGGEDAVLGLHIEGRPAGDPADKGVDLNVNLHGPMDQLFQFGKTMADKLQ